MAVGFINRHAVVGAKPYGMGPEAVQNLPGWQRLAFAGRGLLIQAKDGNQPPQMLPPGLQFATGPTGLADFRIELPEVSSPREQSPFPGQSLALL